MIKRYGEEVLREAIRLRGEAEQTAKFAEEVGEALAAVHHFKHHRPGVNLKSVMDELADVVIMTSQMAIIAHHEEYRFGGNYPMDAIGMLNAAIDGKLKRLERLNAEKAQVLADRLSALEAVAAMEGSEDECC